MRRSGSSSSRGLGVASVRGGDVADIAANSSELGFDGRVERLRRWTRILLGIRDSAKIFVAAMNGPAAGMGLGLALACDLRIASASARCATGFLRVGFSGDFAGPYFLTQLIGGARARQLYLMGEVIEAEEAARLGIVNWLVADDQFAAEVQRVTARLEAGPPLALRYMKRNFNVAETGTLESYLETEALHQVRTGTSEDAREAQAALREKRTPVFRAR